MNTYHDVSDIRFEQGELRLRVDGEAVRVRADQLPHSLRSASDSDRNCFEVSPSGYVIHWPTLDEDLSINGILGVKHTPARKALSEGTAD